MVGERCHHDNNLALPLGVINDGPDLGTKKFIRIFLPVAEALSSLIWTDSIRLIAFGSHPLA
jgi:hypothetical protein